MRRILTVGFELHSAHTTFAPLTARPSLLDWDIVLFRPDVSEFLRHSTLFQGKPNLADSSSFRLKESCEHWRRELDEAFNAGKTVMIFLSPLKEVWIDTGERTHSGTGRNQKTTRHLAQFDNYRAIPLKLSLLTATGTAIKLVGDAKPALAPYWKAFEAVSQYQAFLGGNTVPVCMATKIGDKPVGALYQSKISPGALLLLPDIDFAPPTFTKKEGSSQLWTEAAARFAAKLVGEVVALDKALRSRSELTPEPAWATDQQFRIKSEANLRAQVLEAEQRVQEAQHDKERILAELLEAGSLRRLLFENGKALEAALIQALQLLGFKAEPYRDSTSEFDVVFECAEGRLIGEVEGKDDKPINVTKLRQLSMNVHEDLERDGVDVPAKPVLFGNAFRLVPLQERGDPFTAKCVSAAGSMSIALVATPDLFWAARYLVDSQDEAYADACRTAILTTTGRVGFPETPMSLQEAEETQVVD